LSRTTDLACDQVPSTAISVTGPAGGSRRMSRAPGPGYKRIGVRVGSASAAASGAWWLQSMPTCSSEPVRHRLAMRAVPIAMSRSRGCCRMITLVRGASVGRCAQ
jgi:hypothetical protein